MNEAKDKLRSKLLYTRESIPESERRTFDVEITERLFELPEFKLSDIVLCYISFGSEVSTEKIVEYCLSYGKVLAVPRCVVDKTELKFHIISSRDDLRAGHYGIMEPSSACPVLENAKDSICIVPCLSVDHRGYRLGYGKGYYDRFLAGFKGVKVGLCYDAFRCESELAVDEHDVALDIIITDKAVFKANKGTDPAR